MPGVIKIGSRDNLLRVEIEGRATWENATFFSDFLKKLRSEGKKSVLIDLSQCSFLDSTYFGVLAELAEDFLSDKGEFFIARMTPRVYDDMNLIGLTAVVSVADDSVLARFQGIETTQTPFEEDYSRLQKARQILKAHQTLESLSPRNKEEFKNVVEYFRKYLENSQEENCEP